MVSRPKGATQKIPVGEKTIFKSPLKKPTRGSENFAQNVGPWGGGNKLSQRMLWYLMLFSVCFQKKINKKSGLQPKIIFVVSKMHQNSFLILQQHDGTKIVDQKNENK
jgi:hypothetical protein